MNIVVASVSRRCFLLPACSLETDGSRVPLPFQSQVDSLFRSDSISWTSASQVSLGDFEHERSQGEQGAMVPQSSSE